MVYQPLETTRQWCGTFAEHLDMNAIGARELSTHCRDDGHRLAFLAAAQRAEELRDAARRVQADLETIFSYTPAEYAALLSPEALTHVQRPDVRLTPDHASAARDFCGFVASYHRRRALAAQCGRVDVTERQP